MSADAPYSVTGDLLIIGKKNIVCRCPRALRRLLEADVQYTPCADFLKSIKSEDDKSNTITLFNIRVKDRFFTPGPNGVPKTFEIVFELPLEFNPYVTEGPYGAEIDVQNTLTSSYFEELNSLLSCWTTVLTQKMSAEGVTFYTPQAFRLKFPWKKVSLSQYFESFNPETCRHKINIGLGYHNLKDCKMGISLQLSQFPSTPPKVNKKRKVEDPSETEAQESKTESEASAV